MMCKLQNILSFLIHKNLNLIRVFIFTNHDCKTKTYKLNNVENHMTKYDVQYVKIDTIFLG